MNLLLQPSGVINDSVRNQMDSMFRIIGEINRDLIRVLETFKFNFQYKIN